MVRTTKVYDNTNKSSYTNVSFLEASILWLGSVCMFNIFYLNLINKKGISIKKGLKSIFVVQS